MTVILDIGRLPIYCMGISDERGEYPGAVY